MLITAPGLIARIVNTISLKSLFADSGLLNFSLKINKIGNTNSKP